jgi:hypothetical protein
MQPAALAPPVMPSLAIKEERVQHYLVGDQFHHSRLLPTQPPHPCLRLRLVLKPQLTWLTTVPSILQEHDHRRLASDDSHVAPSRPFPVCRVGSGGACALSSGSQRRHRGFTASKNEQQRDSVASSSGDPIFSLSSDSTYPSGVTHGSSRGLVSCAYSPAIDDKDPPDEEDVLHDPEGKGKTALPWRGFLNVADLLVLILGLLRMFIFYPVLTFVWNNARKLAIDGNIRINATGQAPVL